MTILILDNYDSFTYNLYLQVQQLAEPGTVIDVYRNDKITVKEVGRYDKIILSPGPGLPRESGVLLEVIKTYASSKSILGVCLGEQAIAEVFGGQLTNMENVCHGEAKPMKICGKANALFDGISETFEAGLYHSWIVSKENFPTCLNITVQDETGAIMGLKHEAYDVRGIQFHPESILTPEGGKIIKNWLLN